MHKKSKKINTKINKPIKTFPSRNRIKNIYKHKYIKQKQYTHIIHKKNQTKIFKGVNLQYEIISALDINKNKFIEYFEKITQCNYMSVIFNYITLDKINLFYNNLTFLVFKNGLFLGLVYFKNMTYDFKKTILGDYVDNKTFKSRANISNYVMEWCFINLQMDKYLFNLIISNFRKIGNIMFSNISILVMKIFDSILSKEYMQSVDLLFRYRKLIEYNESDEYKTLTNWNLSYHGYFPNLKNQIVNIFSIRFYKKMLISDDFYPTYIISRQFKNKKMIDYKNIKQLLDNRDFFTLKSYKKFSLDNVLVLSTKYNLDNDIKSLTETFPYEFNFITNFISNNLGNTHILMYHNLYYLFIKKFGENSKYSKYFCKVFYNYDNVIKLLEAKKIEIIVFLRKNIAIRFYASYKFLSANEFVNFINNNINYDDLLYVRDISYMKKLYPLKTGELYDIEQKILITYINNKYKCYIKKNKDFFINYGVNVANLSQTGKADFINYTTSYLNFNKSYNSYVLKPIDIEKISEQIKTICKIICKIYEPYVCNNYNSLHGFIIANPVFRINKDESGDIYPFIIRIEQNFNIFHSNIQENSEALFKLAIEPALLNIDPEPNFINNNTEFELLDIS